MKIGTLMFMNGQIILLFINEPKIQDTCKGFKSYDDEDIQ